jgi:SNF family Na+-dependent transporter
VIFQIGMLAFCVAAVVFGLEQSDILEVVARAFIVFIAVICALMAILMVGASFRRRSVPETAPHGAHSKTAGEPAK